MFKFLNSNCIHSIYLPILANEFFAFDKDYVGNDLNNCGAKTPSAQECQDMCNKEDSCNAFTWIGIALDDDDDNINKCCLKTLDFNKQTSIGLVSGPKQNGNWFKY